MIGIASAVTIGVLLLSRTQFEIESTVDIDAPPERVWAAIVDFEGYAAWCSQLAYLGGEVREAGRLRLRLSVEGTTPYAFDATISGFEARRRLSWIARTGVPRLFDGEHFFELEGLPSGGTRLINREEYRGVLSPVMKRLPMMKAAPAGFARMNAELKRYVEGPR